MAREGRLRAFGGARAGGGKLAERIRIGTLGGFGAFSRESLSSGSSIARSTVRLANSFGSRSRGGLSVVSLIWHDRSSIIGRCQERFDFRLRQCPFAISGLVLS